MSARMEREREKREGLTSLVQDWVPFQPLDEWVRPRYTIESLPPNYERIFHRGKQRGEITVAAADRLACEVFHVHPSAIWGPLWR